MSLANGSVSLTSVTSTTAVIVVGNATNSPSSAPYSYQWYQSTTSGFSPGPSNIITGATTQTYTVTGLIPGTQYYFVNTVTDSASPSPATANSSQLGALTSPPVLSTNQFNQSPYLGQVDMPYNYNTHPAVIDSSFSTSSYAYNGQGVKLVAYNNSLSGGMANGNSGPLHVVPITSDSDACVGFINFNIKSPSYVTGQACQLSMSGNIMWLYATGAITQGAIVYTDVTTVGGVKASGTVAIGVAYDGAQAAGALIRVYVKSDVF